MPMVGQCERCEEKRPIHQPSERRRLFHGPNGEHLCSRHHKEAYDEWLEEQTKDSEIYTTPEHQLTYKCTDCGTIATVCLHGQAPEECVNCRGTEYKFLPGQSDVPEKPTDVDVRDLGGDA